MTAFGTGKSHIFLGLLSALAVIAFAISITLLAIETPANHITGQLGPLHVLLFFVLNIMVEINYIRLPHGRTLSGNFAVVLAAIMVFNTVTAVGVAVLSTLLTWKIKESRAEGSLFFRTMHCLFVYSMAGTAMTLSRPHIPATENGNFWRLLILGAIGTCVYLILHLPLKNIYMALSAGGEEQAEHRNEFSKNIGNLQEVIVAVILFPTATIIAHFCGFVETPFIAVIVAVLCIATVRYIDQMHLISNLWKQVNTDPLLGIYNRNYIFKTIAGEAERTGGRELSLSIALFDLDNFKEVNDTRGHLAGDRVLKSVADAIESSIRSTDTVARFGGDELLVIMPETNLEHAVNVTERTREKVAELDMGGKMDGPLSITISAGVASLGEEMRSGGEKAASELIGRADRALYEAKKEGRNRVVAAPAAQAV